MTALAAAPTAAATDAALRAAGWIAADYHGLPAARFIPQGEDGLLVEATAGQGSFVWRRIEGAARCLSWRWRVEDGPPPTDLTRRGGEDRALGVSIGFAGWPTQVTAWQRTQHFIAQGQAGAHQLPRSVLIYVWGGTGREPERFLSPWLGGLGSVRVLRPADAPRHRWFEERVDLERDWRAAFGGPPPPLQEIAIGTDCDDTRHRVRAAIAGLTLHACG